MVQWHPCQRRTRPALRGQASATDIASVSPGQVSRFACLPQDRRMLGSQAYVQGIERRPARALSGALKHRTKHDERVIVYGYAGDPCTIR